MTSQHISESIVVAILLTIFSVPAAALDWNIKDLGNLGGEDQYAADVEHLALGINNQGQVVGWSITPTQIFRDEPRNFLQAFVSAPNGGPLTNLHNVVTFIHDVPSTRNLETDSQATAINDAGIVVFNAERFHAQRAALYSPPPYTHGFPVGPGGLLQATDINNNNQVVGKQLFSPVAFISSIDGFNYHEFRDDVTDNPIADIATGINDSGQVSLNGYSGDKYKAMIWSENEGARFIATRPEFHSLTVGINNAGQVLGYESTSATSPQFGSIGFLTAPDGGEVNYLDTFGGSFNQVMGLNNFGQVVGQAQDEFGIYHAYFTGPNGQGIFDLDHEQDILDAGWSNIRLAAINDLGQIAGTGDHNGVRRPFLLTPVPEPETYAMMLAGLSVLGFVRRRKIKAA